MSLVLVPVLLCDNRRHFMTSIAAGRRLGPYEIVARIGGGGMGEVFRARDTRPDRTVAIKILPAAFAENAELRTRFELEVRTSTSPSSSSKAKR